MGHGRAKLEVGHGRAWAAAIFSIVLMAALLFGSPAAAHHKPGHAQGGATSGSQGGKGEPDGDADSDSDTKYTEDNDTNDGDTPNNVPDAGDNKHPSGKDRSVEPGGSGNQGSSESDPDDNGKGPDRSNGGPDKPNGSGGDDLADQDGNNGCGNDDDFEDDNEGRCGGKKDEPPNPPEPPEEPPKEPPEGPPNEPPEKSEPPKVDSGLPKVLGGDEERPRAPVVAASRLVTEAGAPLPFTGRNMGQFLVIALAAIAGGLLALKIRRPKRIERR